MDGTGVQALVEELRGAKAKASAEDLRAAASARGLDRSTRRAIERRAAELDGRAALHLAAAGRHALEAVAQDLADLPVAEPQRPARAA